MLAEQFGCAGVGAATGEAALALLRQDDRVDLVVLDLAIPDMDGIVAAQLIRALGARGAVPIVALTDDARASRQHPRPRRRLRRRRAQALQPARALPGDVHGAGRAVRPDALLDTRLSAQPDAASRGPG